MMPNRLDKALFLLGLLSYLGGQIWINITGSMTKAEIAIDGIHWLMLVGAALMMPFAARLPRRGIAMVAGPLQLAGCVLIIGMCMIDFVLWSFPEPEMRNAVIGALVNTPPIWTPFIELAGPVFTIALALIGLHYWPVSRPGSAMVILGTVVVSAWGIGSNPYGYSAVILGFALCFLAQLRHSSAGDAGLG